MDIELLKQKARALARHSYSPYSRFPVAAVFCDKDGNIFGGVNVENMSYGLTICAERNAIFSAISTGSRSIDTLVVYSPTQHLAMPCGACRQVISEFSDDATVLIFCDSDREESLKISDLLPGAFVLNPQRESQS